MADTFHSVILDTGKCVGCTNCIKRCPTQAIRVRNGKAVISNEQCIDCGLCVQVCPHHAKRAYHDSLSMLDDFKYKVALPAPALYGQFNHLDEIDIVLNGLLEFGFDDVFEVARGAEIVSDLTRQMLADGKLKRPVIGSSCPAVVRLISVRFPDLCDHILPIQSPMEVSAQLAREQAMAKTGLPSEDIGIFFLSPCPAKVTNVHKPIFVEKSNVDGALSIADIFPKLASAMSRSVKEEKADPLTAKAGVIGVGWSSIGGEAAGLLSDNYLAADGVDNVIKILEELEDDKLKELDYIELSACPGGCVGGLFTAENGYVARARIKRIRKYLPVSCNRLQDAGGAAKLMIQKSAARSSAMKLADNVEEAMRMMNEIDAIYARLPKLDCGSCGAPSCRALAEDIVRGYASEKNCIFQMRKEIRQIAHRLSSLQERKENPDDCS